jgi:Nucleotidyltransferase domain
LAPRSRFALIVHRLLVRTSRTSLATLWAWAYRLVARLAAAYIVRGEREPTAYVRGSLRTGDFLPGLSDVDLAIVLAEDAAGPGIARERVSGRWARLRRALPLTDLILDYPRIHEEGELADLRDGSALTYGLLGGSGEAKAGYFGALAGPDRSRMLERPGLYDVTAAWRLLSGPERRSPEPARSPQLRRIAAWLELVHWWQWVFPVCIDASGPRTAHLCLKLVAEPVRIWLWLAHGERASGRYDVLRRAMRWMPEEEEALRRALALERSLPGSPEPPLEEILPVLIRLTARIAALIRIQVEGEGVTEVRLAGSDPAEVIRAHARWRPIDSLPGGQDPPQLPLCDWRSLVVPDRPDCTFAPLPADPADRSVLAAAALSRRPGPQPALSANGIMVLPAADRSRTRLRAVQCPVTDPVSFALAAGERTASFPSVHGWSAGDTARRAVAEHRARLNADPRSWSRKDGAGDELALLLTAARAALFLETIEEGEPLLAVTVTETARQLVARSPANRAAVEEALERYREFAIPLTPPPAEIVSAMRSVVLELPAYAGRR